MRDLEHPENDLGTTERRVLDHLDLDRLLADIEALVALESLGGAETPAQWKMAERLADLGCDVDTWEIDLDTLARHPSYSAEVERRHALGVVGRWGCGAEGGRTLVLNGHVDVVPPGDPGRWTTPPWAAARVRGDDGRDELRGRGTADMKGGLCCALAAVRALRDAGVEIAGQVEVQSVVGEEDGGCGTLATVLRGLARGSQKSLADGAIVMEPTRLEVVPAQAGALGFRITIPGQAAHGALRREGTSAIEAFRPVHDALLELEQRRNAEVAHPLMAELELPYGLSIGTLRAGDWASTVPEELVCEGRYGVAVGESLDAARQELETAVAEAAACNAWLRKHSPQVAWWGGCFAPAETSPDAAIVSTVCAAGCDVLGAVPKLSGVPYGSDLRFLTGEGATPSVLFGPGDVRRAHRPDEGIAIAELEAAARVLALVILRFCGVAG